MPKKNITSSFSGFPNKFKNLCYTQTPDLIFDELLKILTHSELILIMIIVRQTFGWKKEFDNISLSQLIEKSGLSKKSVLSALNSLEGYNLIIRTQNKSTSKAGKSFFTSTTFSLNFSDEEEKIGVGEKNTPTPSKGLGKNLHLPVGVKSSPEGSSKNDTIQEDNKNTNNTQSLLLLKNYKIKNKEKIVENHSFEQIETVVRFIEKNEDKIKNKEWFLLQWLKEWFELTDEEDELRKRREKKKNEELEQQIIENNRKREEEIKNNHVQKWIELNPVAWQEILEEETNSLKKSQVFGSANNKGFMAQINAKVRIKKEILWLD